MYLKFIIKQECIRSKATAQWLYALRNCLSCSSPLSIIKLCNHYNTKNIHQRYDIDFFVLILYQIS